MTALSPRGRDTYGLTGNGPGAEDIMSIQGGIGRIPGRGIAGAGDIGPVEAEGMPGIAGDGGANAWLRRLAALGLGP